MEQDLQGILAVFIIDYFVLFIDFISISRLCFRLQNSNDETIPADQTKYNWDVEWSHSSFLNITTDISSAAIKTISAHKDKVTIIPLTIDATPLNNNAMFTDRTEKNSLNSTVINTQETLNGTRNLSQQNTLTLSHFVNEK